MYFILKNNILYLVNQSGKPIIEMITLLIIPKLDIIQI
jgi:hypothetical protein